MSKRPAPWNDQENAALVALYFAMLDKAIAGQSYNKAAMIRREREQLDLDHVPGQRVPFLADRSRGSIEAKLMNASAAHLAIDPEATTMAGYGYKAWGNYQSSLKDALIEAIEHRIVAADDLAMARLNEGIA